MPNCQERFLPSDAEAGRLPPHPRAADGGDELHAAAGHGIGRRGLCRRERTCRVADVIRHTLYIIYTGWWFGTRILVFHHLGIKNSTD